MHPPPLAPFLQASARWTQGCTRLQGLAHEALARVHMRPTLAGGRDPDSLEAAADAAGCDVLIWAQQTVLRKGLLCCGPLGGTISREGLWPLWGVTRKPWLGLHIPSPLLRRSGSLCGDAAQQRSAWSRQAQLVGFEVLEGLHSAPCARLVQACLQQLVQVCGRALLPCSGRSGAPFQITK